MFAQLRRHRANMCDARDCAASRQRRNCTMNALRTLALACSTALILGCDNEQPIIVRATVVHVYSSAEWIDRGRNREPQKEDGDPKVETVVVYKVTVEAPSEDAALTIANYWTQITNVSCIRQLNSAGLPSEPCRIVGFFDVVGAFSPMTRAQPFRSVIVPSHSSDGHAVAEIVLIVGLGCSPAEFSHLEFQLVAPTKPFVRDFRSKNASHAIDLPPFDTWRFESGSPLVKIIAPSAKKTSGGAP